MHKYSSLFITAIICFILLPLFSQTSKTKQTLPKDKKQDEKTVVVSTKTGSSDYNTKEDIDDERAEVLIDWGISKDLTTYSPQDDDGIPYYFGTFRGIFNMEGKNLLIFESDDGTLTFIQIYRQGEKIKWKVYFQIRRVYREAL